MPDPDPIVPPATPPAPVVPPAADPPAADPKAGANDENKFRRLFEAEETKRKQTEQRLAEFETADKTRKEAEMTEIQKIQARADEADARVKTLESENLRRRIAAEKNLSADAIQFLQGDDEATLTANAEKLVSLVGKAPLQAGTVTSPGGQQKPTIAEQIAAAEKAGNGMLSIQLKREQAGIGRAPAQ